MSDFVVSPGPAVTLATGSPAGAGDIVKADPQNAHDARLILSGRLVGRLDKEQPNKEQLLERARHLNVKGRSKMNVDELAAAIAVAENENPAEAEKESE